MIVERQICVLLWVNNRSTCVTTLFPVYNRLHEIRDDDCEWVFPSRRKVGNMRGHLDVLDRLPLTAAGDLRHLWMSTAREAAPRHVHR
jgi:hypothetical protein